jgi:hypothetical protein
LKSLVCARGFRAGIYGEDRVSHGSIKIFHDSPHERSPDVSPEFLKYQHKTPLAKGKGWEEQINFVLANCQNRQ